MKKFLALALILTLALSVSVFAAPKRVVGEEGNTNSYDNGIPELDFPAEGITNGDTTITVNAIAGGIQHRYAVDMDYTALAVTVTGDTLVWDVENFEYVMVGSASGIEPTTTEADVVFTNRSDLPVTITSSVADGVAGDFLTVTCTTTDDDNIADAATTGMDFDSAPKMTFKLTVVADGNNWNNVATFYANYFSQNSKTSEKIATITFKISK